MSHVYSKPPSASDARSVPLDVAGIGIGPANLSLAALLSRIPAPQTRSGFFDARAELQWHPGLLFPEAELQVSFLKDLVTPVDPTHPCSFVAFLVAQKRFYRFVTADSPKVSRVEFNQYLRWVASSLPHLHFGQAVESVTHREGLFRLRMGAQELAARNLVLGSGQAPYIPDCAAPHLSERVILATEFLLRRPVLVGRRVTVVGGGQSGAEIVSHLLHQPVLPERITWVSRRLVIEPLDDSPFANELYMPAYVRYFASLPESTRQRLLRIQRATSDGISSSLLQRIYRRLYALEFLEGSGRPWRLLVGNDLEQIYPRGSDSLRVTTRDVLTGLEDSHEADLIILCTGFTFSIPPYLRELGPRIARSAAGWNVREDFSVEWDGPLENRIYIQNGAKHLVGVSDPNLSLLAWRSATIINSLLNRPYYDLDDLSPTFDYRAPAIHPDLSSSYARWVQGGRP